MPPSCGPRSFVTPSFTTGEALMLSSAFMRLSVSALEVGASTFLAASVTCVLVRGAAHPPPSAAQNWSDTFDFSVPRLAPDSSLLLRGSLAALFTKVSDRRSEERRVGEEGSGRG